jgi:hypothetical protein
VNIGTTTHILLHILRGAWVSIWFSAIGRDMYDRDGSDCAGEVRTNGRVIVMSIAQVSMRAK